MRERERDHGSRQLRASAAVGLSITQLLNRQVHGGIEAGRHGERGREGGRREKERERDLALRDVVRVLGRHGEPALLVRLCESITTTNESEKVRASE